MPKRSINVNVVFKNPTATRNPEIDIKPEVPKIGVNKLRLKGIIISVFIIIVILLIGLPILVWQIMEKSKCLILTFLLPICTLFQGALPL